MKTASDDIDHEERKKKRNKKKKKKFGKIRWENVIVVVWHSWPRVILKRKRRKIFFQEFC